MTNMYAPSITAAMTSETFHLVRNRMNTGRLRIVLGIGVFLIPTVLANAIFAAVFYLEKEELVIATVVTGLILLNVTLFLLHKTKQGDRTLIFGFNHLRVMDNKEGVIIIPFENIEIKELTYDIDKERFFPAIRIRAEELGCITIGGIQYSRKRATAEGQIDCATYLIPSEEEWNRFLEITNQFK